MQTQPTDDDYTRVSKSDILEMEIGYHRDHAKYKRRYAK